MRLNFVCLLTVIFCFSLCLVCAAQQENITVTTYYPSPNGVYSTLQILNAAGRGVTLTMHPGSNDQFDIQGDGNNTIVSILNADGTHGTLIAGRILICN